MLLYHAGQVNKEQLAQSLEMMQERGCRQGEAFIEMGLMSFTQLTMVLGKQVEYLLQQVMRSTEGQWEFHPLEGLPEQFLPPPLKVPALLYRALTAAVKEIESSKIAEQIRPSLDRYVKFSEDFIALAKDLKLNKDERRFVEVVGSKSWRMREVFSVSPLSRLNTAATIWAFTELGFFEFNDTEDDERYLARVETLVKRKMKQINGGTLFDILDLHWISLPEEAKAAYQRLMNEYDPSQYRKLPDHLKDQLVSIRTQMEEAYQVISSDSRRREYRNRKSKTSSSFSPLHYWRRKARWPSCGMTDPRRSIASPKPSNWFPVAVNTKRVCGEPQPSPNKRKGAPKGAPTSWSSPTSGFSDEPPSGFWYEHEDVQDRAATSDR